MRHGLCIQDTMFSIEKKDIELFEDKRQGIRFTKQISVTRISNLPSKFHFFSSYILERKDFDLGRGATWLNTSAGGIIGAGVALGPKLY